MGNDFQKALAGDPIAIAKISGKSCLLAFGMILLFAVSAYASIYNKGGVADNSSTNTATGELSDTVPPNFATLIKEAAGAFKLEPAIVASIYLTEHHIEKFGKDIPSLDYVQLNCQANSSGALGPMQIIDGTWKGVDDKLIAKGISSPNRCRYRDAFFGGAAVIKGKISGQPDARSACGITNDDKTANYTDDCVRKIGRAYCGACTGPACGRKGYNYCEHNLEAFKYAKGSLTAFLPYLNETLERNAVCTNIRIY